MLTFSVRSRVPIRNQTLGPDYMEHTMGKAVWGTDPRPWASVNVDSLPCHWMDYQNTVTLKNKTLCYGQSAVTQIGTKCQRRIRQKKMLCGLLLLLLSLFSHVQLCAIIEGSPPDSTVPRILQGRTLEWVAISFSNAWKWKVKVKSLSRVRLLVTPWTAAYQAPLSMGFSRQEYWSGVPLPSPVMWLRLFQIMFLLDL